MSLLEKAQDLQNLIGEGKSIEGFEKHYHENVTVVEPTGEPRKGKAAQRAAIQQWFGMVQEFHAGGCTSVSSNEEAGVTTAETWMDVTFQGGKRVKMEEVAVQKWEDGQIIHERFYYNPGVVGGE